MAATYVFFFVTSVCTFNQGEGKVVVKYRDDANVTKVVLVARRQDLFTLVPALTLGQSTRRFIKSKSQAVRIGTAAIYYCYNTCAYN